MLGIEWLFGVSILGIIFYVVLYRTNKKVRNYVDKICEEE